MTDFIHIDGSQGEGGGQIVRSSLALSLVTGKPFAIENLRAGREKPGLMRQHLTAVNAAARIGNAQVTGAEIGSTALTFVPQQVVAGNYEFSVGTAGSATLVLQTILPALLIADGPSEVTLGGGTHNPWAPPFDFLQRAFLPVVNRMGPAVTTELVRPGFFPAGGGEFHVSVRPVPRLQGFELLERGEPRDRSATAVVSNLSRRIAEREIKVILSRMNWRPEQGRVEEISTQGPGNVVFSTLEYEHVTEVFIGFGRLGTSAENVANEVVQQMRRYLRTEAPVGPYLADQIMLPLGISAWQAQQAGQSGGGCFRTDSLTPHATTHLEILQRFLEINVQTTVDESTATVLVELSP